MFKVFFLVLIFLVQMTRAQTTETAAEQFNREGRFVKITVLMGNPLKIFVSNKERVRIDTSQLKMEFRPQKGGTWQELKVNKYGEYYSAEAPVTSDSSNSLEVRTTLDSKKSETFKFKTR